MERFADSGSVKPGSFWTKRRLQAFVNLLVGLVGEKGDRKPKHKHKRDIIYAMYDTIPAPYQLAHGLNALDGFTSPGQEWASIQSRGDENDLLYHIPATCADYESFLQIAMGKPGTDNFITVLLFRK